MKFNRSVVLAAALFASAALPGCAALDSTIGVLGSPQATQAANNVKAFTAGFVCAIGSISGLASNVQAALQAQLKVGNALVDADTSIVYVISSSVCTALGGTVSALPAVVPPTATSTLK